MKKLIFLFTFFATLTAYAEEKPTLRLGYFPNVTHAQALYGKATGDFEKTTGAHIEWTSFNAGPSAVEALFAGGIDATYIGPNPAINGHIKSKGELFTIISGSASGGAALVVRNDAGILKAGDFNSKTVATPQLGNTQDVAARSWFAAQGITPREKGGLLNLVPLANPDQLLLFKRKELDGAWTVEPWVSRLEQEGDGKIFLNEKDLWPNGKYVTTHLVVTRAYLKDHRDVVAKLLEAHISATKKIEQDKRSLAAVLIEQIKKDTGTALPIGVIEKALQRIEFTWDPIAESLRKAAEAAHTVGFLKDKPDLSTIYELSVLNEVLKKQGLPQVLEKK